MNAAGTFLNSTVADFTHRALRRSAMSQGFWLGLAGVVVILVLSGPFRTMEIMSFWERAVYWFVIATVSYFCAVGFAAPVYVLLHPRIANWKISSLIAGIVAGTPVAAFVCLANAYVFDIGYGNLSGYTELAFGCVVVAIVGTFLHQVVNLDFRRLEPEPGKHASVAAPILKRLDPDVRAEVVSLHAQGHYVEVTTLRGKQLLLMRLKNAISELEPGCGRQVHRSWWVHRQKVQAARRSSGRVVLTLQDGREVPVSRYNLTEIRRWMEAETAEP